MIKKILATLSLLAISTSVYAVPFLQIGAGDGSDWVWDAGSETWVTTDGSGGSSLLLTARNGAFSGGTMNAFLVVAAVPGTALGGGDAFGISFGTGPGLTLADSGWGAPPLADTSNVPGDLPGHGVYSTYWETYLFTFSTAGQVCNVQPGSENDCTQGWLEELSFTVNSLADGVTGLHFDLYTTRSDGTLYRNAPFSHDAEYSVPEPATLALFGLGLIGFGMARRRKS